MQPHYPAVVEWVYQNRYGTSFQIQRRFAVYMNSERTAQYQLASLVELGFVGTLPVRSTSPNFPYVYFATSRGVNLVRETYSKAGMACHAVATEGSRIRGAALVSVLHELLLTEFDWNVFATTAERADLERLFVERRYFRRDKQLRYHRQGQTRRVVPDSGFMLRLLPQTSRRPVDREGILLLHLTELDNGTMSAARLREKLMHYSEWADSEAGERYLDATYRQYRGRPASAGFRLLLIAHDTLEATKDKRRLIELLTSTLDLPAAMRDRLWFTTASRLQKCQKQGESLNGAIWHRGRDLRKYMADYHSLPRPLGMVRRRKFVMECLEQLPLHPLFPKQSDDQKP